MGSSLPGSFLCSPKINGKYVVVAVAVSIASVDGPLVELFVILEVSFRFSVVFDDMVVTLVTSIKLKISFCHLKTMPYLLYILIL